MSIENKLIGNWYLVTEIAPNVFWIKEPNLVSFYLLKNGDQALLIDSGLGLSEKAFRDLFDYFSVKKFNVICTHAHSDHIGLNSFAENCFLSKTEWDKFLLQNEDKQLGYFLEDLENIKSTPSILNVTENRIIGNLDWQPSGYLKSGDIFNFHNWSFQVFEAPGHTSGSLIFYEKNLNFIFVGDLIYNGTMYLHLKDSSCDDFSMSIDFLIKHIEMHAGIKIWPAHNKIPLEPEFIFKTKSVLSLILQGQLKSIQTIPKDKIFEEGNLFLHDTVKLIMRSIC